MRYGLGFYFSLKMAPHFYGTEYVSDRIAVIHFKLSYAQSKSRLTVINAYAPTSIRSPEELEEFYGQLTRTYRKYRTSTVVIIAGDLNAKLGQYNLAEPYLGIHGKGVRNRTGHILADFSAEQDLFAANTAFKHHPHHIATWTGYINGTRYRNQIDYILVKQTQTKLLRDARTYNGFLFPSDHSPVVMTMDLTKIHSHISEHVTNVWRPDCQVLARDPELKQKFKLAVAQQMNLMRSEM